MTFGTNKHLLPQNRASFKILSLCALVLKFLITCFPTCSSKSIQCFRPHFLDDSTDDYRLPWYFCNPFHHNKPYYSVYPKTCSSFWHDQPASSFQGHFFLPFLFPSLTILRIVEQWSWNSSAIPALQLSQGRLGSIIQQLQICLMSLIMCGSIMNS